MELTQEEVVGYYNKHKIKDNRDNSYTCPYYENKDYIICKKRWNSLIHLYIKLSNILYILYDGNMENDTYETKVIEYKLIYKYVILSSIKNKYNKIHNMITISDNILRSIKIIEYIKDIDSVQLEHDKIIQIIIEEKEKLIKENQTITKVTKQLIKEKQTLKKDLINLMEELTKEKDKIIQQLKLENDQLKNQQTKILSYFT
jgi:hypothetical protein